MADERKQVSNSVQRRPLNVLFVEDNPDDVALCLRILKEANFDVDFDIVTTPEELVKRLRTSILYDIVLTDYALGLWTGMDALRLMCDAGRDTPVILVTGSLGEENAVECIKNGMADYVWKDHLARLPVAISRALEEKALRDEHKKTALSLRESEEKCRMLAEAIPAATFIEQGTRCRYVNRAAEQITGYTSEELLAMNFWDLAHPDSREVLQEQAARHSDNDGRSASSFEIKILTKTGEVRWLDVTAGTFQLGGKLAALITAFDVTRRKCSEDKIRHLAASDPLTGLANHRRFLEVCHTEIKRSVRTGRPFALLFLDLDGLKQINDTYGHLVGSHALSRLASTLSLQCRGIDTPVRFGGDEFALILPETEAEGALALGSRLAKQLREDSEQPALSFSFGVAVYPQDGKTIEALLQVADRALYAMKPGRTRVALSDSVKRDGTLETQGGDHDQPTNVCSTASE